MVVGFGPVTTEIVGALRGFSSVICLSSVALLRILRIPRISVGLA